MILIDSNVPMYLIGADHPNKLDAQRRLRRLITDEQPLLTNVEVFQEILHRYVAIDRREAISPAFETLRALTDKVLSIDAADVERAREIVLATNALSARDALHLAVMEHHEIDAIFSYDRGFDGYPGITRLGT